MHVVSPRAASYQYVFCWFYRYINKMISKYLIVSYVYEFYQALNAIISLAIVSSYLIADTENILLIYSRTFLFNY